MSDPTQIQCVVNSQPQWAFQISLLIMGGILTIFGGFLANLIKLRLENKQEVKCIKISLIDEVTELSKIISRMLETQKTAKNLNKNYLDELLENIEAFNSHKNRLFLISDKKTRDDLRQFYKKLVAETKKSLNSSVVGTLNEDDHQQTAKVSEVVTIFGKIEAEALGLINTLDKYKYKALWFFI